MLLFTSLSTSPMSTTTGPATHSITRPQALTLMALLPTQCARCAHHRASAPLFPRGSAVHFTSRTLPAALLHSVRTPQHFLASLLAPASRTCSTMQLKQGSKSKGFQKQEGPGPPPPPLPTLCCHMRGPKSRHHHRCHYQQRGHTGATGYGITHTLLFNPKLPLTLLSYACPSTGHGHSKQGMPLKPTRGCYITAAPSELGMAVTTLSMPQCFINLGTFSLTLLEDP